MNRRSKRDCNYVYYCVFKIKEYLIYIEIVHFVKAFPCFFSERTHTQYASVDRNLSRTHHLWILPLIECMLCVLELRIESKSIYLWFTCILAGVGLVMAEGLDPEAALWNDDMHRRTDTTPGRVAVQCLALPLLE